MTTGTEPPSSFFLSDVLPWLGARGLDAAALVARGVGVLGSVSAERLRMGRQGPVARTSVSEGYIDVRVDMHGSRVGNPFHGADAARLCRAYDELLHLLLTVTISVDECLRDFEDAGQDASYESIELTPLERRMLSSVAEKHGVKVHRRHVQPSAVTPWLVYHAKLLSLGQSLRLLAWGASDVEGPLPHFCHAHLLMGALLWLASSRREELLISSSSTSLPGSLALQVRLLLLLSLLSSARFTCASLGCAWAPAHTSVFARIHLPTHAGAVSEEHVLLDGPLGLEKGLYY